MKAKWGALMVDGRGKIGGHVASKNRGGAYLRTKVTPSNPNSSAQSKARSILSSLSQQWRTLTDTERLAWNEAVKDWATTDIFGDAKNPSGLNLFVKVNSNISNVEGDLLTTPPEKMEVPSSNLASISYDVSSGILSVNIDGLLADGVQTIVRATPPMSQGVTFVKNQLRVIGVGAPVLGVIDLTGNYATKYGAITAGANVYASIQYVTESGQKSTEQVMKVSVVA